ncbi:hypothetical protein ACQEVY_00510 [Streptomyces sp. CA-288835]|uniref:hypothetical protein n=1 Tax=Streptomyces sp. CA-288835 TaxID=3240069 RepID=UPI003D903A17
MTQRPVTTVHLTAPAAHVITTELRTADYTTETGGILLGHHAQDTCGVRSRDFFDVVFSGHP